MLRTVALLTVIIALACALILFFAIDRLPRSRGGWIAMILGVCCLPLLGTTGGTTYAVQTSSTTAFCLECHEMGDYGRSLFIDDPTVLPAVHYQNRLIDREKTCFECHTDYALYGDVKAKFNGLKHVYVHYLGEVPEQLELYQPYPNYNCLHCHDDGRRYLEAAAHTDKLPALRAGETSCLSCHARGHALDQVEEGNFWLAP